MTCEEYDQLVARAEGRCDRCGNQMPHHVIDHDHAIGPHAVRGLLDSRCNSIVAAVERFVMPSGPDELTIEYLRRPFYAELPPQVMAVRTAQLAPSKVPTPYRDKWQFWWDIGPLVEVAECATLLDRPAEEIEVMARTGRLPYWRRDPWAFRRRAVLDARQLYSPTREGASAEA